MDRGGLIHVSDSVFNLFVEIEVVLRSQLRASSAAASLGAEGESHRRHLDQSQCS